MINPHAPEETLAPVVSIGSIAVPRLRPNANNIWIDYTPDKGDKIEGGVIIPGRARKLEFVTAVVIEKGPECKFVKEGDRIIVAAKGIINGEAGILVEGRRYFATQEPLVVAVVEEVKASE